MDTPAMRVSLSPEGTNRSHGENKNKKNYTKTNPPTIAKISRCLGGQVIMDYFLK